MTVDMGKVPSYLKGMIETDDLSRPERFLIAGVAVLVVLAAGLPAMPQDPAYHRFADARAMWGVPRAMDTLSNVFFIVFGGWGVLRHLQGRLAYTGPGMREAGFVFFLGFLLTGFGSGYYHLDPNDRGLAWDRLGMVVAFAGVLGLAAADRVSERSAKLLLPIALVGGASSVGWFLVFDSVTPYAVLQFGGIAMVMGMLWLPAQGVGPNWAALAAAYALAKVFEAADHQVFLLTAGSISGHTLKHVFASLAVLAVALPLALPAGSGAPRR
jgi:hypothetical protein